MHPPPDHAVRSRFTSATDTNISLECPAGSGKTHALTSRIGATAARADAVDILPQLVVVTYTGKAADEIQQRARAALVVAGVAPEVQQAFNRVFFGTIHSFAVELIRNYGHFIGVPSVFEVAEDLESVWQQFLHSRELSAVLASADCCALARYVPIQTVFGLAQRWDFARAPRPGAAEMPAADFRDVYLFPLPKRAAVAENIRRTQDEFRRFEAALSANDDRFVVFPKCYSSAKEFAAVFATATVPWRKWLSAQVAAVGHKIAVAFRAYRIARGALSYDDQVQLAVDLMRNPAAAAAVRARNFRVLLDEAQDTDPSQFEYLIEAVRPIEAVGHWSTGANPPAPGRFVMTGDGEQSIYGGRADLATYRRVHDYITRNEVGEAIAFDVTFRCGRRVIDVANQMFPALLNGQAGQVPYITLRPKPNAPAGQVAKVVVPRPVEDGSENMMAAGEAKFLAQWLKNAGLAKLRARAWGQVAILCPRKRWFPMIRDALRDEGIESQLLSTRLNNADSASYAWFTAVAYCLVYPRDSFEIAGALREVFGVSDHALAHFTKGDGTRIQIEEPIAETGEVVERLGRLNALRNLCADLPLRTQAQHIAALLRPRLTALPLDHGALMADLDRVLLSAAEAERDGLSLHEFVDSLIADWEKIPDEAEDMHKVSIITNLRAKGLEWDAVVVPYLFRAQREPAPAYPRLIGNRNDYAQIAMSGDDVSDDERCAIERARLQEMQRVMYVTCTRPRHTLVLLDDQQLFEETSALSAADALLLKSENAGTWSLLTDEVTPSDEPVATIPARPVAEDAPLDLTEAQAQAQQFPRLLRPSQLITTGAHHEDPEARGPEDSKMRGSALDFGVWWHDTMRSIDWRAASVGWSGTFASRMEICPDRDRAGVEWQIFLKSELATLLSTPGATIITEAPCFIPVPSAGLAIDGIMDLAIFFPDTQRWLVVDWKTARHGDATIYRPQINTYRETLEAATGYQADGAVYFTGNGELERLAA